MRVGFFEEADRSAALRANAGGWLGTPFRARAAVRGAGADCVHLCGELMREVGALDGYEFPAYPLDYAKHRDESLVLAWLDASPRFVRVPSACPPRTGDIACFQLGRCVHHCGVVLEPPLFIHAAERVGVVLGRLDDPTWQRRLSCLYRALAL